MEHVILQPTVVPDALSPDECDVIIQTAENAGWIMSSDSVDEQPAWEMNLGDYAAGSMAVAKLREVILGLEVEFVPTKFVIYVRKYGAEYRPSLAAHHDRSCISFSVTLSEGFTGGTFFYLDATDSEQEVVLSKGSAVVFGGNVMHGVRPVQEGIRYSLVVHSH